MQRIVALTTNHDTGIAACKYENEILDLFIVNEERLNRNKLTRFFPKKAFSLAKKPDEVVIGSLYTPVAILKLFNKRYSKMSLSNQFSYLLNLYVTYQVMLKKFPLLSMLDIAISKYYYSKLLDNSNIKFYDHHHCHACSAYYSSGFKKALIITIDMMGDGVTVSVSVGTKNNIKKIYEQNGFSSIGAFYSKVTQTLGFKPNRHEGKITGLAAYGQVQNKLKPVMKQLLSFEGKGFSRINYLTDFKRTKSLYKRLKCYQREDVSATAQAHLETETCKFVSYWQKRTGIKKLCLAGGLFANVKLNQRIHELKGTEQLFVFPHMGDGGLAHGALMAKIRPEPKEIETLYLGPSYSNEQILAELQKSGLRFKKRKNIETEIAKLLKEGKVVARFDGAMEFGPRALGNRSILYQTTDSTVNDWLNKRLERTEFMPFAPMTLKEHANRCYNNIKGAEIPARFMAITFECTRFMKEKSPGVVHVDGTARPQIVSKEENPSMHKIISKYYEMTGIPSIINTSFNMHEEPIVCTPAEAIKTFKQGHLDYLAIGKYLTEKLSAPDKNAKI